MKLFKKKLVKVTVERCWSTTWSGLQWTVHAHYEKRLLGFIKWTDTFQMTGPFNNKQDAKRVAKNLRYKHNLK